MNEDRPVLLAMEL